RKRAATAAAAARPTVADLTLSAELYTFPSELPLMVEDGRGGADPVPEGAAVVDPPSAMTKLVCSTITVESGAVVESGDAVVAGAVVEARAVAEEAAEVESVAATVVAAEVAADEVWAATRAEKERMAAVKASMATWRMMTRKSFTGRTPGRFPHAKWQRAWL
ncbi:hypothetical protein HK101_005289, partial [Irineochytrium annulatum]